MSSIADRVAYAFTAEGPRSERVRRRYDTFSVRLLRLTVGMYALATVLFPLPIPGSLFMLFLFGLLVVWILTPVALWFDTGYVRERTDRWDPHPVLYAIGGLFIGLIGFLVVLYYLNERQRVLEKEVAAEDPVEL